MLQSRRKGKEKISRQEASTKPWGLETDKLKKDKDGDTEHTQQGVEAIAPGGFKRVQPGHQGAIGGHQQAQQVDQQGQLDVRVGAEGD